MLIFVKKTHKRTRKTERTFLLSYGFIFFTLPLYPLDNLYKTEEFELSICRETYMLIAVLNKNNLLYVKD